MPQPRATHEVFRQRVVETSYDRFVSATPASIRQQGEEAVETTDLPSVDRIEELRREDDAYLEGVARTEREDAIEELQREMREGEQFRRERGSVRRKVHVADGVRARVDDELIGGLGFGGAIRKRRIVKKGVKAEGERKDLGMKTEESGRADVAQRIALVSGYSSSSDDDEAKDVG